ncbi:hypothetical protein GCM10018793_24650 [Streptomyces sulfonofaciens]|uniref:Type A2 lantipeptide n=1 Tax=Streptomyces sulfonofaciens TaxID=68272 RepID=A0A919G330_9ACTN|nr:type A2 lantipeptide [Streptomyces sulfonofaciens]GHH77192.1 hypothetical protein GCM10018793_24650 [Streptomyces sulfonofaciens]
MASTPNIETHEISDADLDMVSGGLADSLTSIAPSVTGLASVEGPLATVVSNVAPSVEVNASGVSGLIGNA